MQNHRTKFFLIIAIGILFLSCAGPESLLRTHAYEGTRKAASEMATVFAVWNGPGFEMASICSADGKSYWKFGTISNCRSVIYLLPGKHEISVQYEYANYTGEVSFPIDVQAGRAYRVFATSYDLKVAHFELREMPADFKLTYKDVAPIYFNGGRGKNSYVDPSTAK
jgi:hypothetical protein